MSGTGPPKSTFHERFAGRIAIVSRDGRSKDGGPGTAGASFQRPPKGPSMAHVQRPVPATSTFHSHQSQSGAIFPPHNPPTSGPSYRMAPIETGTPSERMSLRQMKKAESAPLPSHYAGASAPRPPPPPVAPAPYVSEGVYAIPERDYTPATDGRRSSKPTIADLKKFEAGSPRSTQYGDSVDDPLEMEYDQQPSVGGEGGSYRGGGGVAVGSRGYGHSYAYGRSGMEADGTEAGGKGHHRVVRSPPRRAIPYSPQHHRISSRESETYNPSWAVREEVESYESHHMEGHQPVAAGSVYTHPSSPHLSNEGSPPRERASPYHPPFAYSGGGVPSPVRSGRGMISSEKTTHYSYMDSRKSERDFEHDERSDDITHQKSAPLRRRKSIERDGDVRVAAAPTDSSAHGVYGRYGAGGSSKQWSAGAEPIPRRERRIDYFDDGLQKEEEERKKGRAKRIDPSLLARPVRGPRSGVSSAPIPESRPGQKGYRPYTIDEYRRISKPVKLGGLGPDLMREDVVEKREQRKRAIQYAARVAKTNRKDIHDKPPRRTIAPPSSAPAEMSSRKKALEFAKSIPKPIVRKKEEDARKEGSPGSERVERERDVQPSELERLQAEHDALADSIKKIRQEFS